MTPKEYDAAVDTLLQALKDEPITEAPDYDDVLEDPWATTDDKVLFYRGEKGHLMVDVTADPNDPKSPTRTFRLEEV